MKVLVIYAHPDHQHLNFQIYKKFCEGLFDCGHKIDKVNLYDIKLDFKRLDQKRDKFVDEMQNKIKNTDAIVMIYPVWWYNMPAIVKNFIDRVFEVGFAFTQKEKQIKLPLAKKPIIMNKKTGRLTNLKKILIINTADTNALVRKLIYKDTSFSNLKNGVLKIIGAKNVKNKVFRHLSSLSQQESEKLLQESYKLGKNF